MTTLALLTRDEIEAIIRQAAQTAAEQVAARINRPADPDELWDAKQVAAYLGVSAYTVAHEWAHQRGFPAAIVLGDGPRAKRRWKASEVMEWVERRQGRAG